MSYFLANLPLWLLITLIVAFPTALAMSAQALIHWRIGVKRLVQNNEIAGFKFATVGVIYAVLLAFTVVVVCAHQPAFIMDCSSPIPCTIHGGAPNDAIAACAAASGTST